MAELRFLTLGTLFPFNPALFTLADPEEQRVADFVLAASLAANDLKDIMMAWEALELLRPGIPSGISVEGGQLGGLRVHVERLSVAVARESLALVRDNEKVCRSSYFQKLTSLMSVPGRIKWKRLINFACLDLGKTPIHVAMRYIRHSAVFHYDPTELATAFRKRFDGTASIPAKQPYISYGDVLMHTRYFYADAMAETLAASLDGMTKEQFWKAMRLIVRELAATSYVLVNAFLRDRGQFLAKFAPK